MATRPRTSMALALLPTLGVLAAGPEAFARPASGATGADSEWGRALESAARADRETRVAEAEAHPAGGDAVYLARASRRRSGTARRMLVWRSSEHERIVTDLRWSRQRDALAFATRNRRGAMTLVVVLIDGFPGGHVMTWPIPEPRHPTSLPVEPTVSWLGRGRVGFGRSEVSPDVVASWQVRQ